MGSVQYIVHESPAWRAAADYLAMGVLVLERGGLVMLSVVAVG
jgi:hypothetical protein